jgi:hypothetical protein
VFVSAVLLGVIALFVGCSGSSSSKTATVQTTLSDPSTCKSPQGPFSHIYVTVTDVQIHQNANASPSDSGWVA